jgi:2-methylisocitrate lyase-like PEP mutase family enzyme
MAHLPICAGWMPVPSQKGERVDNNATATFRELLANDDLLLCPLVGDPLSARLAQRSGVPIALLGGFAISAHRYALPDAGLITFTDVLDQIRNVCDATPGFPIIADADTGYGNAMNVRRTVTEFAKAGAASLLIEDQVWPKKCGHYGGPREVISRAEARMKMRAAVDARGAKDIVIIGRTDARSGHGLDEALARCNDFVEEGADIVFIEALETLEEMRRFAGSFKYTWASMMPKTPVVSRADLRAMGFKVVTYNVVLPAAVYAMQAALKALVADDIPSGPPMVAFDDLTSLVGLNDYVSLEGRYRIS